MARMLITERIAAEKAARLKVRELDNETLAARLLMMAERPNTFDKWERKALQYEAAIRLRRMK